MKTIGVLVAAMLLASVAARGQGQFIFSNEGADRFRLPGDAEGVSSIGSSEWTVQVLGAPHGAPVTDLKPLATTGFQGAAGSTKAGWVIPVTVTVPGVVAGDPAAVMFAVFRLDFRMGCFGPFSLTLGGDSLPLPTFPPPETSVFHPFTANNCIPEPSTLLLALLGLGALVDRDDRRDRRDGTPGQN